MTEKRQAFIAFIVSTLLGGVVGIGVARVILNYGFLKLQAKIFEGEPSLLSKYIFLFSIITPILVLILLFLLSKKFSFVWKKIKLRTGLVILMLLMYMITTTFTLYSSFSEINKAPLLLFYIIASPLQLYSVITLWHSNLITIATGYIATKDVAKTSHRILLAFIIIWMISLAGITPIIPMFWS